ARGVRVTPLGPRRGTFHRRGDRGPERYRHQRYAGSPVHITHVSTAGSVEIIRGEKEKYTKVTCDTCPHYFTLSDEATLTYDTNAKVNPPLRSRADVAAIK